MYALLLLLCLLSGSAVVVEAAEERERIGLVLAGGGARGIAHAGVIRALEEMQIPVDAIAGTSMGALVGGLYATGMSPDDLQRTIRTMDWDKAFEDSVARKDQPPRRKSDDYDYPTGGRLAFRDGRISIPLGLVQGQQTRQIIKELVYDASHVHDFDELAIPYRAVATDVETGDAYVFSEGDIVTAMRASMSLPALLAPVEYAGRLLVDGGMAMNIPVEVGRQMEVDRLIVVDIGTPLKPREEIDTMLSVTSQMLGFLTRKNSMQSLQQLGALDILIRPELGPIGMLDFDQSDAIYELGYAAAKKMEDQLRALAVNSETWKTYLGARTLPDPDEAAIAFIDIENDSPVSDDVIRVRISQTLGESLDREQLSADIGVIYALDYWEIIDYETVRNDRGHGLLVKARAKSWGRGRFKLGLNLLTDLDGSSDLDVGASYLRKGINGLGGEFYGRGQVGDEILLYGEIYQPLDLRSRFFLVPFLGYEDHEVTTLGPEYDPDVTVGAWRVRTLRGELAGGVNIFNSTQLRLGLFRSKGESRVDGFNRDELPEDTFNEGGVLASLRYDSLDDAFFPTRGAFLFSDYQALRKDLGADEDFERWRVLGQAAFTFGADSRHTVIFTGKSGQTVGASNEPQNYFQLGGLFNLSGLSNNFFSGRQMAFAMGQYQYRLSKDAMMPIKMPLYLGASLEGGQLWSKRSDISSGDFINAGSIYVAIDSPIGPVYVAYGRSEDDQDAIYLALGWPFLNQRVRVGR